MVGPSVIAEELLQPSAAPPLDAPEGDASQRNAARQSPVHDLFSDLFTQPGMPVGAARTEAATVAPAPAMPAQGPRLPTTLADSGLTLTQLAELVLKQLYAHGSLVGQEVALHTRLPFGIVDEALRFLKDQRCLEISGGDLIGRVSYRYALSELGRVRAREVFEQCRYVGPAPVPLEQYVAQCRRQSVAGVACTVESLQTAFSEFILRPGLLDEIGPAVCSGRSIFVYGPPGNGKTLIAKGLGRYLNLYGGEIYVPYAIQAENSVITLFDPVLHQTTDDLELSRRGVLPRAGAETAPGSLVVHEAPVDLRWRRIRRPMVITGGELTLDMLELQYNQIAHFYNAPLHIKANGGVFLIDDFGRQLVSPRDLLNRWIIPLEERIDYLTPVTGRKFSVPFEQLIIFSTNLDPQQLVDDAFLRRIRHKIKIGPPDRAVFERIFELACRHAGAPASRAVVDYLFENHYQTGRVPKSSDPRDLVELARAISQFHGRPFEWTPELIVESARRLFLEV